MVGAVRIACGFSGARLAHPKLGLLTVHYHEGAVFGVSIPIYFSSAFK
jgi:hypothetical protein